MIDHFDNKKGKIRLPALISNGMILQRNKKVKIWGWAPPYLKMKLEFKNINYHVTADKDGKWSLIIAPQSAGGPYELKLTSSLETIIVNDIFVGEVWLCSGQSNMELPMRRVKDTYPEIIKNFETSKIREFKIPISYNFSQKNDDFKNAFWKKLDHKTIYEFSAVALFIAKKLKNELGIPIGIINASVGGSPIEAWVSKKSLHGFPQYLNLADKFSDQNYIKKVEQKNIYFESKWYKKLYHLDEGLNGEPAFFKQSYNDSSWLEVNLPADFSEINFLNKNGVIWFRKYFYLSDELAKKKAKLWLGRIVDADTVYINNKRIGSVTYQYPPRKYEIPKKLLKRGKNLIAVRVVIKKGQGEFVKDKPYKIIFSDQDISLEGKWKYKIAATIEELKESTFIQWHPTGLFNAMIAPLFNYTIKGIFWYQGESNTKHAEEYRQLFPRMITEWRKGFADLKLPFIYAQLPEFGSAKQGNKFGWANFRNVQREALKLNNTAMTVNLGLGEWNDLHPLNKAGIAERFFLAALNLAYDEDIVYSGPEVSEIRKYENEIIISFSSVGEGFKIKGDYLQGFEIAAANKRYLKAETKLKGNKVVLWHSKIKKPKYFRYAWRDNPSKSNLYNSFDLPTGTFEIEL